MQVSWEIVKEGVSGLGEGIWTWILGMTPEELAEEAARNGNTVGEQFVIAYSNAIQNSAFGEFSEGVVQYVLMGGKSSEEFYSDAEKSGQSIGTAFLTGMVVNSTIPSSLGGMIALSPLSAPLNPLKCLLFNLFARLCRLAPPRMFNLKGSYTKVFATRDNAATIEAAKHGEAAAKAYADSVANTTNYVWDSIWNGSDAQQRGKYFIESFAKGMENGKSAVNLASSNLYKTAYNGTNNNGNGSRNFGNVGTNLAGAFSSALGSQTSKNNAYNSGYQLSAQGVYGARGFGNGYTNIATDMANLFAGSLSSNPSLSKSYNAGYKLANEGTWGAYDLNSEFEYVGDMAGQGYVAGIRKNEYKAEYAGGTVANATLYRLKEALGIASPSKETYALGKFFDEGFANAIEDYTYTAEDMAKQMARASLQAIRTTDSMFANSISAPSGSTAGYGVSAANQNGMMNMASSIYQAVVGGMAAMGTADNNRDIKVIIDGKEVFKVVQKEQRDRGVAISNGAFSR